MGLFCSTLVMSLLNVPPGSLTPVTFPGKKTTGREIRFGRLAAALLQSIVGGGGWNWYAPKSQFPLTPSAESGRRSPR